METSKSDNSDCVKKSDKERIFDNKKLRWCFRF